MATSDVLLALRNLFPMITFNVRTRINEDIQFIFQQDDYPRMPRMEADEELYFVLRSLERDLYLANKKLKKLKHAHSLGDCSIEDLQDHQYYIFELEFQIEEIMNRLGLS